MLLMTETGSWYEVDERERKIRRLAGRGAPTRRFGADGAWRPYASISTPKVGEGLTVLWRVDVGREPDGDVPLIALEPIPASASTLTLRTTQTSRIVAIHEDATDGQTPAVERNAVDK